MKTLDRTKYNRLKNVKLVYNEKLINKIKRTKLKVLHYDGRQARYVDQGSRSIFLTGKYVIKHSGEGIFGDTSSYYHDGFCSQQAVNEGTFFLRNTVDKKDLKYFPKVVAYDLIQGIVVMEKKELIQIEKTGISRTSKEYKELKRLVKRLCKQYNIRDVSFDTFEWCTSIYGFNVALDKKTKEPVIYDLGCT